LKNTLEKASNGNLSFISDSGSLQALKTAGCEKKSKAKSSAISWNKLKNAFLNF
jgi:hypothetical protein